MLQGSLELQCQTLFARVFWEFEEVETGICRGKVRVGVRLLVHDLADFMSDFCRHCVKDNHILQLCMHAWMHARKKSML